MKPYYDHGGITIYCGDCAEIIPTLGYFDLLLTDPPYGIGRDGSKDSRDNYSHGRGRKPYPFLGWDNKRPDDKTLLIAIDHADNHIIWGGNYFTGIIKPGKKWLVWDKGQRINNGDGELAYTSFNGPLRIITLNVCILKGDGPQHPTQKPERLFSWCIHQAGTVKSILDPFPKTKNGSCFSFAKHINFFNSSILETSM